jgi:hypothetical protein
MATNLPERTSDWQHYDEAAITIAAAMVHVSDLDAVAKHAYNVADALAKEALRRRLADPNKLYTLPIEWIRGECSPEKLRGQQPNQEMLGKQFLWRFLHEGHRTAETYQETIQAIEALRSDEAATLAKSSVVAVVQQQRQMAINLLKAQF